jgi:hypothetical protein
VARAVSSLLMVLLLNCTLLFGGCISCSQFFMLPRAKDCCKAGKCERSQNVPAKRECQRMPMACNGMQHVHVGLAVTPATVPVLELAPKFTGASSQLVCNAFEHSPPDRTILNSTLLI